MQFVDTLIFFSFFLFIDALPGAYSASIRGPIDVRAIYYIANFDNFFKSYFCSNESLIVLIRNYIFVFKIEGAF